jgi:hypothetical protein
MYVPTLPAFREAVEISTAAVVLDKDEEEVEEANEVEEDGADAGFLADSGRCELG